MTQESDAVNGSHRRSAQEITDELRERIRSGLLEPGARLATQSELAAEFGVERGTVRQAVRALQAEGLLTTPGRGSPPTVTGSVPARDNEPEPTMVGLAPRLAAAFAADEVRIDVVSLTAETLMLAVGEPVRLIHEGRIHPSSVHVRILLPARDIELAFPASIEDGSESSPVHERWLEQRNAQGQVLRHNLRALRASHGIDVHVTFRALPFTPPMKLYLLNGEEALFAYYRVAKREEEFDSGSLEMWDTLGTEATMFSYDRRSGSRDAAFVDESQNWFNALWETITSDLTLS